MTEGRSFNPPGGGGAPRSGPSNRRQNRRRRPNPNNGGGGGQSNAVNRGGGGQSNTVNRSSGGGQSNAVNRSGGGGGGQNNAVNRSGGGGGGQSNAVNRSGGGGGGQNNAINRSGGGGGGQNNAVNRGGGGGQSNAVNRSRPIYENVRPWRGRQGRGPAPNQQRNGRPADPRVADRDAPVLPSNPREAALRILHAVDTRSAFSDRLLEGAHAEADELAEVPRRGGVNERDQALLHDLVKGTLRWRGRIDFVLDSLVHIGISQVQPWVKNVLRMGAYQILFYDRVPAHAAVDESVKLAHKYGHPGTAGLVNSVLRRLADAPAAVQPPIDDAPESLAAWGSHPLWLTQRWCARFGPETTRELMMANNKPGRVGLRANRLKTTREGLIERLAAEGVVAVPATLSPDLVWLETPRAPASLKVFREGWCTVQDESESLVARLVAPQVHERILDLCAAPGGKCTHLAELIGDEGDVWAMERTPARVPSIEHAVDRLGTHSVHVQLGDGRTYTFPMPFDRVLVDAPCSGLGVLGRRADARWRKGPEVLREMPPIQLELLAAGGRRARPGGVLVYSVCSFEPEETTEVVDRFLLQNPSFVLESAAGVLPAPVVGNNGFMYVLPHIHGCDGAFAARFRKT